MEVGMINPSLISERYTHVNNNTFPRLHVELHLPINIDHTFRAISCLARWVQQRPRGMMTLHGIQKWTFFLLSGVLNCGSYHDFRISE